MIAIISSQDLGCVDNNGRSRALMPGAAGAVIATIPIAPTFLVVPARSLRLGGLGAIRSHGSCLIRAKQKGDSVASVIFGRF